MSPMSVPPDPVSPPTGRRVAEKLLSPDDRPWVFSFAMGWTKFDVAARIAVVLVLTAIPIVTTRGLSFEVRRTEAKLKEHMDEAQRVSKSPEKHGSAGEAARLANLYQNLAFLAQDYVHKADWLSQVQIATIALPFLLLVLAGIGEYWRFKSIIQLKKAINFLKTPEGIARLQESGGREFGGPTPG